MRLTRDEFQQLRQLIALPMCFDGQCDPDALTSLRGKGLATTLDGWNAATRRGTKAYFFSPASIWHRISEAFCYRVKYRLAR